MGMPYFGGIESIIWRKTYFNFLFGHSCWVPIFGQRVEEAKLVLGMDGYEPDPWGDELADTVDAIFESLGCS